MAYLKTRTERAARRPASLVAAMFIDALGSGLAAPFGLLYGHVVVGLSLTMTGVAVSVASALGLIAGPLAGSVVDRVGAARVVIAGNLMAAVGGVGLLLSHDVITFGVATFVSVASQRIFWASFGPLVSEAASPQHRERWFGWLRGARYIGVTAGGALASLALLIGQQSGLRLIIAVDAASYLAAALLIATAGTLRLRTAPTHDGIDVATAKGGGYRIVLADRGNLLLAVLNVFCALACCAPLLAMPVYVLGRLHQSSWVPGALAAIGAAALASSIMIIHRFTHGRLRISVLVIANLLWAGGCLGFALADVSASITVAVGVCVLAVIGLGLAEAIYAPTADALPLAIAPPGLGGRYTASHQLAWGVASAIAPVLTATLLEAGAVTVWVVLAAISLTTALAYALLRPRLGQRAGVAGSVAPDDPEPPAVPSRLSNIESDTSLRRGSLEVADP